MTTNVRTRVRRSVFLRLGRWAQRHAAEKTEMVSETADAQPLWPLDAGPVPGDPPGTVREKDGTVTQF
ncbi:MAG: hypothetical protein JWM36_2758 [Hyphomicrobiales bacterium]|nr:hypothetical protein [Hyphomicrobiales bacterium]